MRTATDLQDAFALLEKQADAYAAEQAAHQRTAADTAADTGRTLELEPSPRRRRPSNRVAIVGSLTAAAAVVALALGVATWGGRGDDFSPAHRAPHPVGPAPRSYQVTLDPKLGMRLLEVNTSSDATGLQYYSRRTEVDVTVTPKSAHKHLAPGLDKVDLGANGVGYYSDGSRSVFVEENDPGDPATGGNGPTPTPPATRYARDVVWEYAPGAFADVLLQNAIGTRAQLVRLASALSVADTAKQIPAAVSLSAAPPGMRLVSMDSELHQAGDNPPYDLTDRDWFTNVQYRPADGGEGVAIQTTSADVTSVPRKDAEPIRVSGHAGFWYAKDRELDLDFGQGRYAVIAGSVDGAAVAEHTTLAELIAVAKTLTMTKYPQQPGRWFPATRALP